MFIKRKLFVICSLFTIGVPSYAADFKFESIKRDSDGLTFEEKKNDVSEYKEIITTGYGLTEQKALDNAFRSAIQQYVGVVIDSETQLKNGQLLKDKILTASNGYIQEYKKLSQKNEEGLFEVEIKAVVKSQKIYEKVKSLNIDVLILNNAKNIQARVETKTRSKKEVSKILKKTLQDFLSPESLQEMINVKIEDAKILEDDAKDDKVPLQIKHSLKFDYEAYINKVAQLEQVFENLGAKLYKRVDLPYGKERYGKKPVLRIKNTNKIAKIKKGSICIIKKYGQGYKTDIWTFPGLSFDTYLSPFKELDLANLFNRIIEVKGSNSVLYSANLGLPYSRLMSFIYKYVYGNKFTYRFEDTRFISLPQKGIKIPCISFLFHGHGNSASQYFAGEASVRSTYSNITKFTLPIDVIGHVKTLSMELEEI